MPSSLSSKGIYVRRDIIKMSKSLNGRYCPLGSAVLNLQSGRGTEDRNRGRSNGRYCSFKKYIKKSITSDNPRGVNRRLIPVCDPRFRSDGCIAGKAPITPRCE